MFHDRSTIVYPFYQRLFTAGSIEDVVREKIRPLGPFSDFVVETLHHRMAALLSAGKDAREGLCDLAHEIEENLASLTEWDVHGLKEEDRKIARVDAIYAYNAFIQVAQQRGLDVGDVHKNIVPAKLHFLVAETARQTASPPVLTYEDLVLNNPIERDPRVFMAGQTGYAERDFYLGHLYIERLYGEAIRCIEQGLQDNAVGLKNALKAAAPPLEAACNIMRWYLDKMQADEFGRYRVVFGKNPVHDKLGPSGRFSMKVPYLTLLVLGRDAAAESPKILEGIMGSPSLFPGEDFARLWHSLPALGLTHTINTDILKDPVVDRRVERFAKTPQISGSVVDAIRAFGAPAMLLEAFADVKAHMDTFTRLHIYAAQKHTVGPDRPAMGAQDREEMIAVLRQRYLLNAAIA